MSADAKAVKAQYEAAHRELKQLGWVYSRARSERNRLAYITQWNYTAVLWDRLRKATQ